MISSKSPRNRLPSNDLAGGRFPMNHASGLVTPDRSSWSTAGGSGAGGGGRVARSSRRGIGGSAGGKGRGDLSLSLAAGPPYLGPLSLSGKGKRRGGGGEAGRYRLYGARPFSDRVGERERSNDSRRRKGIGERGESGAGRLWTGECTFDGAAGRD